MIQVNLNRVITDLEIVNVVPLHLAEINFTVHVIYVFKGYTMNLTKKLQKLMPRGVELIIQGKTVKGHKIKIVICKEFPGKLQADQWYELVEEDIKQKINDIGEICKMEVKDEI